MEINKIMFEIISILKELSIISAIIFGCFLFYQLFKFIKLKIIEREELIKHSYELNDKIKECENEIRIRDDKINRIDNSLKLVDFIRDITGQWVVIKFKNFNDGHNLTKVTEENIKKLVSEIAIEVRRAIRYNEIDFESLVLTQEFYDKYIVNSAVILVKDMLDKVVNNYEEEE